MTTESKIYKILQGIENVSNLHASETQTLEENVYFDFNFSFSGMKFLGNQVTNQLFTLNKMTVLFRYELKKSTTRSNVLEAINNYNAERPLINATLGGLQGKKITIVFSSQFISDDEEISERMIIPLINIMAPSPLDFVNFLEKNKIAVLRK